MNEVYLRLVVGLSLGGLLVWNIVYGVIVSGFLLSFAVVHYDEPNPLKASWKMRGIVVGFLLYFAIVGFHVALKAENLVSFIIGGAAFVLGVIGAYLNTLTVEVEDPEEITDNDGAVFVYNGKSVEKRGDVWVAVEADGTLRMFDAREEVIEYLRS